MNRWRPEQKAEAVGLAVALGAKEASKRTGVPRRTISSWLGQGSSSVDVGPTVAAAILRSEEAIADRLWEAVSAGTDAILEGLKDPKQRLGDKARALEIAYQSWALLSGRVTSRSESVNANVGFDLAKAIDSLTPEERTAFAPWFGAISKVVPALPPEAQRRFGETLDNVAAAHAIEQLAAGDFELSKAEVHNLIIRLERHLQERKP